MKRILYLFLLVHLIIGAKWFAKTIIDDSSGVYLGDQNSAKTFVGRFGLEIKEYTFFVPNDQPYLYIVGMSYEGYCGFIGYFFNTETGALVYTHHPNWRVSATGIRTNVPLSGSSEDITNLNA